MLNHLYINNFAIVPELELGFLSGFTAITGETGAGKSILVDALGLLLGERSDARWVRSGYERADLSAEFSIENNPAAKRWLAHYELSMDDHCLLRRTINTKGRSRAFVNGSPVTVSQIQTLGNLLVEIHGQNEHLKLTKASEQMQLLDSSGHYLEDIEAMQSAFEHWKKITDEIHTLETTASISPSDLDFLNFQLEELQQHQLGEDSIAKLQIEHDRLAAGEDLQEALTATIEALEPERETGASGVNAKLVTHLGRLQQFTPLDQNIADACQMLQEAALNCSEAISSLRMARDGVDQNPGRFEEVARKLGQLSDLARKHRVEMRDLEDFREQLSKRIELSSSAEQNRRRLTGQLSKALDAYRQTALALHVSREQHATILSSAVTDFMTELGMAGGSFELLVTHNPQGKPTVRGDDEVQININANPGTTPGPLSKIASGGELSRISLAIKVATMVASESVTQIFDEVDAGIGGEIANSVGRLLQRLSQKGQTLCVTHLAQVAVCATQQLQVSKQSGQGSTSLDTRLLAGEDRVDEIARMLSGRISDQSQAHAIELLNTAVN